MLGDISIHSLIASQNEDVYEQIIPINKHFNPPVLSPVSSCDRLSPPLGYSMLALVGACKQLSLDRILLT